MSWHEEVSREEDVAKDGVEEDEDEGQDGSQEDRLEISSHTFDDVAQCVVACHDIKQLKENNER